MASDRDATRVDQTPAAADGGEDNVHALSSERTMQYRVVLVTGASGLVGKAVQEQATLLEKATAAGAPPQSTKWVFAGSKDADLTNRQATRALFQRVRPTHVLHLAAHVGGLFANMKYQVEFWRDNMAMQDNIFECCKEFGVTRLVSCLSTCIFPDGAALPMDESVIMNGPPHFSNRGYAYAKRTVLMLGDLYNEQYGTNFATVVPCNVYGKHDNFSIENGHVLPGLMHKCYLAKKNGTPLVIWGSGKPLRQFIYSSDLAKLMLWYLLESDKNEPVILATDPADEISIAQAAHMVADAMGFNGEIVFDGTKADGQYQKTCSNARLRAMRPDFAFTSVREAIAETASWFVANYAACRK
jgi:GDP-L-fucose synthase